MISDFLLKLIVGGGLIILIALGVRNYFETKQENEALTSEVEQNDRTQVATSGILDDITAGQAATTGAENSAHESRDNYQRAERQARSEDQRIAELLDTPIPQRLRDLARERRLARESGAGRPGAGSGDDGEEAGTGR